MSVHGGARDAQTLTYGAQREPRHALVLNGSRGFMNQGIPKVPVVVGAATFAGGSRGARWCHEARICGGVDNVNIQSYISVVDVDDDNI